MLLKVRNCSYYYFRLDFFFLTTVDVPAIAPVFFPFFPLFFDSMCLFLLSFIRTTSSTALVTPQSGILGVHRKGNIRLRLLIDVNLNRHTDVWRVSNLPCQGYFIMLAIASNQSKTLPSPCYISHIDNQRVGSGSGPVGDKGCHCYGNRCGIEVFRSLPVFDSYGL